MLTISFIDCTLPLIEDISLNVYVTVDLIDTYR